MRGRAIGPKKSLEEAMDIYYESFIHTMGFNYLSHCVGLKDGSWSCYFNNKEWKEIHLANQFIYSCPIINLSTTNGRKLILHSTVPSLHNDSISKLGFEINKINEALSIISEYKGLKECVCVGWNSETIKPGFFFDNLQLLSNRLNFYRNVHTEAMSAK